MIMASVQARMGSTRLPGKVLKDIVRKPMLWHIINRLKKVELIDKIVIATSINEKDKAILKFANRYGIKSFMGSENDLVDRHFQTAKKYKADIIVRITADNPLTDPKIIDKVIRYFLNDDFDYVSNNLKHTYPLGLGLEVFSYDALKRAWQKARTPYEREVFTVYIQNHPEMFKIGSVEHNEDLSHMRWTVDTKEDLKFVREIYRRLYKEGEIFYMDDVLKLLKYHSELLKINAHIKQKEVLI